MKEIIKNIEKLLNGDITAYKIGKDTGIRYALIQRYIDGTTKIENMTIKTAEKLNKYYLSEELKMKKMRLEFTYEGKTEVTIGRIEDIKETIENIFDNLIYENYEGDYYSREDYIREEDPSLDVLEEHDLAEKPQEFRERITEKIRSVETFEELEEVIEEDINIDTNWFEVTVELV